jgi:hypothetical protein
VRACCATPHLFDLLEHDGHQVASFKGRWSLVSRIVQAGRRAEQVKNALGMLSRGCQMREYVGLDFMQQGPRQDACRPVLSNNRRKRLPDGGVGRNHGIHRPSPSGRGLTGFNEV